MIEKENFAVKLCGLLQQQTSSDVSAQEWRLVGQEKGGLQIFTWQTMSSTTKKNITNIGVYSRSSDFLTILHTFDDTVNIIQASVNSICNLLAYVVKNVSKNAFSGSDEGVIFSYKPYLLLLGNPAESSPKEIEIERSKQVMVQFLHKKYSFTPKNIVNSFLLMVHLECIKKYTVKLFHDNDETVLEPQWQMDDSNSAPEIIVKSFSWAQWDSVNQSLYYIHYRTPHQSFATIEDPKPAPEVTPTLSALQFHTDLPHETVLNIPLNLPQLPSTSEAPSCGQYEDDPVPLRIHDCSLDLQILSDPSGIVCICHHYLYQPLDESIESTPSTFGASGNVHFAYSVTLLHHGCVIHCIIPDLPWTLAKSLRPSFSLFGDHHLLVNVPTICMHLLDTGLSHEANCHIVLPARESDNGHCLAPLIGCGANAMVDLVTLDIVTISVANNQIVDAFKSDTTTENKLSILHYLIQHQGNSDLVDQLIGWTYTNSGDKFGLLERISKEFLVSWSYISTKRCLPSSALPLTHLLPYTTNNKFTDVKIGGTCVSVRQERLWSPAVVLLSPRQRVAPFCSDIWTHLWDGLPPAALASEPNTKSRFRPRQVRDKLRVSLDCYQPEALSRCTTPMSPTTVTLPHTAIRRSSLTSHSSDLLPFYEFDTCTASKQEHIISVNLREMSMHLMQHGGGGSVSGSGAHAHGVATRWAGAQVEASRALCLLACRTAAACPNHDRHRGFAFIDEMLDDHRYILFRVLESYHFATDSIAFPVPQGFSSFFTYLGYKVQSFDQFVQFVHRNVFELQIDVLKAIISEEGNDPVAVQKKLRLVQLVGRGRARRTLSSWTNRSGAAGREALILRARDHTNTILAGHVPPPLPRHHPPQLPRPPMHSHSNHVPPLFANEEHLSPLNTFLDMLTAKANLNELDFNLVIEGIFAMMADDNN